MSGEGPLSRYADFELIGEGVSAKVYRAVDLTTDSPVAVKILDPNLRTDEISIERFRREIRITRILNHSQIISVYDLIDADGSLALIMEYVPGHNLKDYLRLHAPLEVATVLGFMKQILEVLAVCHAKDVIHRDLKPQNVIVDPEGRLKLLDFGIARMTSLTDLTQTGTSLGSPEYMAPELFAASTFDPRTDLYAVGVMAYELLTGELPFRGDSVPVLFQQHLEAPVPRVSAQRSEVPKWLDALIEKLLAKSAYQRYQVAEEVLGDLERKQVVSKSLPQPARRECLRCARQTLADLPICTFCGYSQLAAFERGSWDVHFSRDEQPGKIERFLARVFQRHRPLPRRPGTLLAAGVDRPSAELLKSSGQQHGLYLTLKLRSRFFALKPLVSTAVLIFFGYQLLRTGGFALDLGSREWGKVGFLIFAMVAVVCWVPYRIYCALHRKPLVGPTRFMSKPRELILVGSILFGMTPVLSRMVQPMFGRLLPPWILQTSMIVLLLAALSWVSEFAPVERLLEGRRDREISLPPLLAAEYAWVNELAPLLAEIRDAGAQESLQLFISGLIEKYHMLVKTGPLPDSNLRENLRQLVRGAAQMAALMAELETAIDDARLAEWSRTYLGLEKRVRNESDPGGREALLREAEAVAGKLRRYYELDAKHAALSRRLIHLQYAFNTLLGKSLVFHAPLGEIEVRELESAIRDLEQDLAVSHELRQALGELG